MSAVQLKEVVEALLDADTPKSVALAKYVEQNGIAPPDGMVLVPKEPTYEMFRNANVFGQSEAATTLIWATMLAAAMLAAAPEAKP